MSEMLDGTGNGDENLIEQDESPVLEELKLRLEELLKFKGHCQMEAVKCGYGEEFDHECDIDGDGRIGPKDFSIITRQIAYTKEEIRQTLAEMEEGEREPKAFPVAILAIIVLLFLAFIASKWKK